MFTQIGLSIKKILLTALAVALVAMSFTPVTAEASNPTLNFYIAPPTVQNTYVAGAEVATFNSYSLGSCPTAWASDNATSIGTITTTGCTISAAGTFGGATLNASGLPPQNRPSGNGTNYASIPSNRSLTLTLDEPETYLGFWWSAGDSTNSVKLYSGGTSGTLVGTFTTATLVTMLNGGVGSVTAINGTSYNSCEYFGNPVTTTSRCGNLSNTEPFAYVHLIGSNGLSFDTLVFSQGNSGGFEFDNMAIARAVNSPDPTLISFPAELNAGNPSQTASTCSAFTSNFAWTASNFSGSPVYSITPSLPAGLSFNTANGTVSGTPTAASVQTSYTVTASSGNQSATKSVTLSVTDAGNLPCPTPTPSPTPSPTALPATGNPTPNPLPLMGLFGLGAVLIALSAISKRKTPRSSK